MHAVEIREATVVGVDPSSKTATIRFDYATQKEQRVLSGVRMNSFKGSKACGAMPEENEPWLVVKTSESGQQWFLLQPRDHEGTMNGDLDSGDAGWSVGRGGKMILRKDGAIELYSKATTSMYMIPAEDLFRINAVNYEVVTPQGSLTWKPSVLDIILGHDLGESSFRMKFGNTGEGFGAKDWAGDGDVYGSVSCGSLHVEIDKDGSISTEVKNHNTSVLGDLRGDVDGESTIRLKGDALLETSNVEAKTSGTLSWTVKVSTKVECLPELKLLSNRLVLTEEDGFAVDGIKLLQWFLNEFQVIPSTGKLNPACAAAFLKALNTKVTI